MGRDVAAAGRSYSKFPLVCFHCKSEIWHFAEVSFADSSIASLGGFPGEGVSMGQCYPGQTLGRGMRVLGTVGLWFCFGFINRCESPKT